MSIGDNYESPYQQYLRDRRRINYIPWGEGENENKEFCKTCYSLGLGRLIPSLSEKHMLFCRNCGKSYSMDDVKPTPTPTPTKKRFSTTKQGPIIISKGEKKPKRNKSPSSPNSELTTDDLDDLRSMGYRV